jgi:hypothetical protein
VSLHSLVCLLSDSEFQCLCPIGSQSIAPNISSVLTRHAIFRDMPPVGGFESIKYKRNLPFRGPGAYVILGGVTAICAYGFYRLGKGNLERR